MTRTTKTVLLVQNREVVSFNVSDKQRRVIGCTVDAQIVTFTPSEKADCGWIIPAGNYFAWLGQATRDGRQYGASQTWNYCASEAERETEIAKYIANARKRAAKLAPEVKAADLLTRPGFEEKNPALAKLIRKHS